MKALVYSGEGISYFSLQEVINTFEPLVQEIQTIDPYVLSNEAWEEECQLLIFPGGRDIPYDRSLKGKGTAKIKQFVENGGSFLGICAGGYFGAAEVIFEKGTALEVHETRELCFYPGAAIGTLYPERPFMYEKESGAHASWLSTAEGSLHLYYNGGCAFPQAESYEHVTPLASYLDAEKQPAIIHCKIGKGNVILSGVHFEMSVDSLMSQGCHPMIVDKLQSSAASRQSLINTILKYLACPC